MQGMKGHKVAVEANVRVDREQFVIIGLPDASIKESKERVLSCLHAMNIERDMKKITIHLSPSDIRKSGTGFDCAILLAVLQEILDKPLPIDESTCVIAALSLNCEHRLKASVPLLDRMDFVLPLQSNGLQENEKSEAPAAIRGRTTRARKMQRERYSKEWLNGFVPFQLVDETCRLSNVQKDFTQQICFEKKWSNRAQAKLIRIARTIADLEGSKDISEDALLGAIKWKSMTSELQISSISVGG